MIIIVIRGPSTFFFINLSLSIAAAAFLVTSSFTSSSCQRSPGSSRPSPLGPTGWFPAPDPPLRGVRTTPWKRWEARSQRSTQSSRSGSLGMMKLGRKKSGRESGLRASVGTKEIGSNSKKNSGKSRRKEKNNEKLLDFSLFSEIRLKNSKKNNQRFKNSNRLCLRGAETPSQYFKIFHGWSYGRIHML